MPIKYNHLSIFIISISIVTAITNYAFARQQQKCFTCVCKSPNGKTNISEPNCNFDSLLTNKSIQDLPNDIKQACIQECQKQNLQYANHLIWK